MLYINSPIYLILLPVNSKEVFKSFLGEKIGELLIFSPFKLSLRRSIGNCTVTTVSPPFLLRIIALSQPFLLHIIISTIPILQALFKNMQAKIYLALAGRLVTLLTPRGRSKGQGQGDETAFGLNGSR